MDTKHRLPAHPNASTMLATLLLAVVSVGGFAADAGPGTTPPTPTPPTSAPGEEGGGRGRGREERMKRMIAENPELAGVDPNTPEGQEKIRNVMQARGAAQMRTRMAENQAEAHAKLREAFAMTPEDFTAIEPLITRVENLRLQERLTNTQGLQTMLGGRGGGNQGRGGWNPQMLLGDTPLEPSVQEAQDAAKALKSLLEDPQANATEVDLAVARLRKAREAVRAVLTQAQGELQAVLSHRQEALLVDRGILD